MTDRHADVHATWTTAPWRQRRDRAGDDAAAPGRAALGRDQNVSGANRDAHRVPRLDAGDGRLRRSFPRDVHHDANSGRCATTTASSTFSLASCATPVVRRRHHPPRRPVGGDGAVLQTSTRSPSANTRAARAIYRIGIRRTSFHARRSDDARLRIVIEGRQRFVEQQHLGIGHERSCQPDALPLAAGNLAGAAREQMADAKGLRDCRRPPPALAGREPRQAVFDVLRRRQVRKEREMLKDEADAALRRLDVDAGACIENRPIADRDPAVLGLRQAGDAPEQRRLARPGLAKDDGDAGREVAAHVEHERRRQAFAHLDGQVHESGATAHGFRISA